jgi:hypothetical protein
MKKHLIELFRQGAMDEAAVNLRPEVRNEAA